MLKLDIKRNWWGNWQLSHEKIREAAEFLGIELPIMIRYLNPSIAKRINGNHTCKDTINGITHIIMLDPKISSTRISKTLWHELAHAQQTEQATRETGIHPLHFTSEIYIRSQGGLGVEYFNNTFEVAARKIANDNQHKELIKT